MNDEPYRIRLRSPWEGRRHASADSPGLRYRFRRWFGRPTGIDDDQRVWLVVEPIPASESGAPMQEFAVALNGQSLPPCDAVTGAACWDVTTRLNPRNEVVIEYSCPAEAAAMPVPGITMLDQESSANLRDLPTWIREVRLEIVTSVKGATHASP